MPTLDWLNRADAFTTAARVPYRLLEQVSMHAPTCWRHNKTEMARLKEDKRLYWGVSGTATTPMRKLFKTEAKQGMSSPSLWTDAGLNQHASSEIEDVFGEKASFETPKEMLIKVHDHRG